MSLNRWVFKWRLKVRMFSHSRMSAGREFQVDGAATQTHWLSLQQRVEHKVSLLVYKCLQQAAPSYLAEMCVPVSATDNRCHLRSATHGDLAVPRVRLARYGRSFSVSGPLLWNSLPLTVRDV